MPSPTSLVPNSDFAVHIVLDDFDVAGRVYRETDEANASFAAVVEDLTTGQYNSPVRVVAFNTAEGWARDVSEDVAHEVLRRLVETDGGISRGLYNFLARYIMEERTLPAESD